jgi:alpha-mannosidase
MFLKINQQLERCDRVIRQRVRPHIHRVIAPLTVSSFDIPGEPMPVPEFFEKVAKNEIHFQPFTIGNKWGTTWGTTWFKVQGRIPQGYPRVAPGDPTGHPCPLELILDLGWFDHSVGGHIEGMVYRPDGTAIKAVHPRNYWVRIVDSGGQKHISIADDGSFTVYLEAACNPLLLGVPPFIRTDLGEKATGRPEEQYVFRAANLTSYDQRFEDYWLDLQVVSSVMREIDPDSPRYWQMGKALQRSLNAYDEQDPATVADARAELHDVLSKPANASSLSISAIGHAHIDSAWLWPVRETRRKVGRTVANVLALMDEDPDFKYAMSSAQQYVWLEQARPDLFRRMMERIREGRFIPVGGMWVESDGMLPAGESLIRQISYGQRYFRSKLGVTAQGVWLPDSFGYTSAWPQIARRSGYQWFLTQKISWNDTTKFPHHSFMWEGLDGTQIFTHFPPADTYAAWMIAKELHYTEKNFRDKDLSTHVLMLFGYGDGGGGPTREMMGRLHRFHNLEGMPRVSIDTPNHFFETAKKEMIDNSRIYSSSRASGLADEFDESEMPTWKGELYLELHRGTLTSQQEMKRLCREEESLLRTVEYLCAAASLLVPHFVYPTEKLDNIWKDLLLNQFHDILPGSGIAWVHREARQKYAADIADLRDLMKDVCEQIARQQHQQENQKSSSHQPMKISQFGPHAWEPVPSSVSVSLSSRSHSKKTLKLTQHSDGTYSLRGGRLDADIRADGTLSSVVDTASNRELVSHGLRFGTYELLKDEPAQYDAWNVDRDAFLRQVPVTSGVIEEAQLIDHDQTLRVVSRETFSASSIRTVMEIHANEPIIHYHAHVDWHEHERFLKVCFPLALSTRYAFYDTQYGTVARPVRKNTSSEEACYESCTHRFVRIADSSYGVSVVNNSTYGCDVTEIDSDSSRGRGEGTLVRTSLLSSPVFPDPHTDQGEHDFTWRIVADATPETTLEQATDLNAFPVDGIPQFAPLAQVLDQDGHVSRDIELDWVKMADDGSGDVIVRLFEPFGQHAEGTLHLCKQLQSATVRETGTLEYNEVPADLPVCLESRGSQPAQGARVSFQPYEMATLRIHRGK